MNEQRIIIILKIAGLIGITIFCIIPVIYMVITGFAKYPNFLSSQVPFGVTVENYRAIFSVDSLHFVAFVRNSILVSMISACISVGIAGLAAYAITRLPFYGKSGLVLGILAVSLFPQISMISYLYKLMSYLGWINSYMALICPYVGWTLPLSVWILVSYFSQIPRELDKAALIDGCSHWKILYKVILPVALPGMLSTFLLAFIFAFNEFLFALLLTTDYSSRTIPVGIALFEGVHGEIPWGAIMAASTVAIIPVIILTVLFQRHIIQGLTRGAVKG